MQARGLHAREAVARGMDGIPEQAQFWLGGPIENTTNGNRRDVCDRI